MAELLPYLSVQAIDKENVSKYGIVDGIEIGGRVYKVKRLVEKPSIVVT